MPLGYPYRIPYLLQGRVDVVSVMMMRNGLDADRRDRGHRGCWWLKVVVRDGLEVRISSKIASRRRKS